MDSLCWFPDETQGEHQVAAVKSWRFNEWHLVLMWWKEEMGQFLEVINNM